MKQSDILLVLVQEFGKFTLRAEEKQGSPLEGGKDFIQSHLNFFDEGEKLIGQLEEFAAHPVQRKLQELMQSAEEPCYSPLKIGEHTGFLIHIFKGEQDIAPWPVDEINIGPRQYRKLLHNLNHDLKRLESPPSLSVWLYFLKRYGKWVVASPRHLDVSLYHYAWVKMALTACLGGDEASEEDSLTVVAGKFTGISDLLVHMDLARDLTPLKGQLYRLQLLRELIVEESLRTVGLPWCNCLQQGGEDFCLLVRHRDRETIENYFADIDRFLWDVYHGKIGLSRTYADCPVDTFFSNEFVQLWERTQGDLEQRVHQRFSSQDEDDYHRVFAPAAWEDREYSHAFLRDLGETLVKTRWTVVSPPREEDWNNVFSRFEVAFDFVPRKPEDCEHRLFRFGNSDFSSKEGIGFKFSENISFLPSDEPLRSRAPWTLFTLDVGDSRTEGNLLDCLAPRECLHDFFFTYLAALLREKKYRKFTYLAHLKGNRLFVVASPAIALSFVKDVYSRLKQFIHRRYQVFGYLEVYPAEFSISRAIYEHEKFLATIPIVEERLCLCRESLSWSTLDRFSQLLEKLQTLSRSKGKRNLAQLWGVAEHYRDPEAHRKISWNYFFGYITERFNIGDSLDKKFLQEERGHIYLSLAMMWNHWISMQE